MPFLTAMVLLLVNYQGSEIVGLAAGESIDPGTMIPFAIRNVTFRILFIYIVPVFCLVLNLRQNCIIQKLYQSYFRVIFEKYDLKTIN